MKIRISFINFFRRVKVKLYWWRFIFKVVR